MYSYYLLISTVLSFANTPSPTHEEIDYNRIKGKKVVKLLQGYDLTSADDIASLSPSCYEYKDSLSFSTHTKEIIVDAPIDDVWETYKSISPTNDNQDKVSFGLLFSPEANQLSYMEDSYDGIKEGQVVFWNLKFVLGLVNVAVGQKIMEVNDDDKFIKICYLAEGKSHGTQYIRLFSTGDNQTKIEHFTQYKSDSKFRDKKLYPKFHEKAISEFHEDVIQQVMRNKDQQEEVAFHH